VPNYRDSAGFKADVEADFRIKGELIKAIGLSAN
jgi:hypothetical protein